MPSHNRERCDFTLHCCRRTDKFHPILAPDGVCVGEAVLSSSGEDKIEWLPLTP